MSSSMPPTKKRQTTAWSPEEVEKLTQLRQQGLNPIVVATHFPERTASSVTGKIRFMEAPKSLTEKPEKWRNEEIDLLARLREQGFKPQAMMDSEYFPSRTLYEVSDRISSLHLKKSAASHREWALEEIAAVVEYEEKGWDLAEIARWLSRRFDMKYEEAHLKLMSLTLPDKTYPQARYTKWNSEEIRTLVNLRGQNLTFRPFGSVRHDESTTQENQFEPVHSMNSFGTATIATQYPIRPASAFAEDLIDPALSQGFPCTSSSSSPDPVLPSIKAETTGTHESHSAPTDAVAFWANAFGVVSDSDGSENERIRALREHNFLHEKRLRRMRKAKLRRDLERQSQAILAQIKQLEESEED